MPAERPFLTPPDAAGTAPAGRAPDAVFDLAVNRAWAVVRGVGHADALAAWHARTRFARRVPLGAVLDAVGTHPGPGEWHWAGGPGGAWVAGRAPFP